MRFSYFIHYQLFTLLLLSVFLSNCGSKDSTPHGVIVYNVSYPVLEHSILENVLPSEMTILYKGDMARGQLRSVGGIVNSEFISNQQTKVFKQLLKSYQDYYVCELNQDGVDQFIQTFPSLRFEPTEETIVVAGYNCEVTLAYNDANSEAAPMRVYHTNELQITNPNWYTQFNSIDGVLMGYELEQFGMTMRLEAKEVLERPIEDAAFLVDPKYVSVNSQEMETKFEHLISEFND